MSASASAERVDRDLVAGWLHARSLARRLPIPVADHGGWRVDTRSDQEWCRYVFADAIPAIADLAQTITIPRIYIKLCHEDNVLRDLLTNRWRICPASWLMTAGASRVTHQPLLDGYIPQVEADGDAIRVGITTADGMLAASGYAAEAEGVFVYDRIVTRASD
ncbi:MAG: N-acetyltransferase [Sphingomonas sp.]|jgi:hypothetical protein|uniref:N-acetyltransferase n=1 Tax=Sphingomonas sp. TaxID=28214 RepID=UPI00356660CA